MTLNEITAKSFPNQINSEIKWVEKLSKLSLLDVTAKRCIHMTCILSIINATRESVMFLCLATTLS